MSRLNNFLIAVGIRQKPTQRQRAVIRPKTAMRARLTSDGQKAAFESVLALSAPSEPEQNWSVLDLSEKTLQRVSMRELVRLLADLSPEISNALYHFILLGNAGYELKALGPDGNANESAQAVLDDFTDVLASRYGTLSGLFDSLLANAFMGGAFSAELILDRKGRKPIDLVTVEPRAFRYQQVQDPERGIVWQLGQFNLGKWINLEVPTVRYVPIHPIGNPPYGRPLISPAVFSSLFLIGLLRDLRRVVANQGYNRDDVSIDIDLLRDMMPEDINEQSDEFRDWVNGAITEVSDVVKQLEPDDTFVHANAISVHRAASESGGLVGNSQGATNLISALERMCVRALKTQPLVMGLSESVSETHANRQWEIHAAGIKSMQQMLESMLEYLFGVALQVQGVQATVSLKFSELRASEMLRDAQTEQMQIANARSKYELGIISQVQMANELGYDESDQTAPRQAGVNGIINTPQIPEESERKRMLDDLRAAIDIAGLEIMARQPEISLNGVH